MPGVHRFSVSIPAGRGQPHGSEDAPCFGHLLCVESDAEPSFLSDNRVPGEKREPDRRHSERSSPPGRINSNTPRPDSEFSCPTHDAGELDSSTLLFRCTRKGIVQAVIAPEHLRSNEKSRRAENSPETCLRRLSD